MTTATLTDPAAGTGHAEPADAVLRECLTFRLGAEEYGIDILCVQEIRGYEAPTRMAGAPAFMLGVLNLRGLIVPILDLRARFGLAAGFDALTVIVVLNVLGRTVGAVVDSVCDVIELTRAQIKPAPEFNAAFDARHINGLGSVRQGERERLLVLLDIEHLIGDVAMGLGGARVH